MSTEGPHSLATPEITVCIVTGRRIAMLDLCLASLQQQVDPPRFEVLVVADHDPEVIDAVLRRFPDAGVATVERAYPGAARNVLIEAASGELLLFLDDDVTVDKRMLRRLADLAARHPEAMVFGGPNDTPPKSSKFQVVQGAVLASAVGTGPVRRRYGSHPAGAADERWFILCNLAIRRRAMLPFALDLVCAEENALLAELSHNGAVMHYDPALVVFHERRPTYNGFVRQMWKYGKGRGQLLRRDRSSFRVAYVVPSALVAYLAVTPVLALIDPLLLAPLAVYLGVATVAAGWISKTLGWIKVVPLALRLIVSMHAAYGLGVYAGVLRRRTGRRGAPAAAEATWVRVAELMR